MAAATTAAVLAHSGQFTWDEALMILVPVALLAGVLVLANQRAKKLQAERAERAERGGQDVPTEPDEPDVPTGPGG